MSIEKSTMKALGVASAIVAFLAAQFWGVPFYIESEGTRQVNALNSAAETPAEVTMIITKMEGVEASVLRLDGSVVRVEGKVDAFSLLFTGYLERQANK